MTETILVTGGAGYVGSHVVVELARAGICAGRARQLLQQHARGAAAPAGARGPSGARGQRRRARRRRAARGLPRSSDRRRRALRGTEGRRRVGGAAARVLRRQRRRRHRARRSDGRGGRRDARLQLVGDGVRPAGRPAGHRGCAAAAPAASTAARSASSRISCATSRAPTATGASPSCAISIPPARMPRGCSARRRAAGRPTSCRCCAGSRPASSPTSPIYGGDWPTPDGTCIRDYLHVQDLAEGHVAALRYLAKAHGALTLNLGAGRGHSVLEVVAAFEKACGRRLTKSMRRRRAGRRRRVLRRSDARGEDARTGARRATLDAICADAWRWQKNGGRY